MSISESISEQELSYGEADAKPLTDEERKLLTRLLSDPFSYPLIFKTWIKSFIEGSDILLPRSSVQGLTSLLGSGGGKGILGLLPAGTVFPYAGVELPAGAYWCNGASYSVAGHDRLFKSIGYTYGGSGANFNVPDLRRRLPFGAGAGLGIGSSDGQANEANRHIDHHHFFQDTKTITLTGGTTSSPGNHGHTLAGQAGFPFNINAGQTTDVRSYLEPRGDSNTGQAGDHNHSVSVSGSHTHSGDTSGGFQNNHPAYLVIGYIINF